MASIVEMGFSADQAAGALRQTNGNVEAAINHLISGGADQQYRGNGRRDERLESMRGGGRGGRGGGRGRGDRGDRGERGDRGDRGDRDMDGDDGRKGQCVFLLSII